MSPIMVRPVREQLEHDRVIRLLQTRYRRRYDVGINPGAEQNAPVGTGSSAIYPDVVLSATDRGHRLLAVVEVETGESVNHLEALAQWKYLGALRAAFFLYVPSGSVDAARRLLHDNDVPWTEIWSFHAIGDQIRFNLAHRSKPEPRAAAKAARRTAASRPAPAARSGAKPAKAGVTKTRASKAKAPKTTKTSKTTKTTKTTKSTGTSRTARTARTAKTAARAKKAKPAARKSPRAQKRK